mmetsp:Transcript_76923/g.213120  ORF Transcript_76923/g.213120 Transcript_76923/m.213120 type:complete len:203 (+) Transcript_76923:541-1149(+)
MGGPAPVPEPFSLPLPKEPLPPTALPAPFADLPLKLDLPPPLTASAIPPQSSQPPPPPPHQSAPPLPQASQPLPLPLSPKPLPPPVVVVAALMVTASVPIMAMPVLMALLMASSEPKVTNAKRLRSPVQASLGACTSSTGPNCENTSRMASRGMCWQLSKCTFFTSPPMRLSLETITDSCEAPTMWLSPRMASRWESSPIVT